jgi:hypothetical protein
MKKEIKICEQTIFLKLIKKFMKIILFAILYTITTMIAVNRFGSYNSTAVALMILGVFGFVYSAFQLLHEKL